MPALPAFTTMKTKLILFLSFTTLLLLNAATGPEKTAPSHTPEWIHRCTVLSEDAKEGRIDYLTVDDLSTLLFVANPASGGEAAE